MYHLRIAVDRDPRASIPGRAFTGRAYEGHVFWDTEIFMLPFYLYTAPPLARNLLRYRHHTLDGARARARSLGYAGACFAWESTVTGEDVTPTRIILKTTRQAIPIFTGTQQVHVTADIAYAVWRYWEATHDETFLAGEGADLLFETARFWASRVTRDERGYHIRQVVGPDEYHHDVELDGALQPGARSVARRIAGIGRSPAARRRRAVPLAGGRRRPVLRRTG
jgi:trehalose/maltose hydrolase-like predicted phosphorylase